jgi:hypothetical protein
MSGVQRTLQAVRAEAQIPASHKDASVVGAKAGAERSRLPQRHALPEFMRPDEAAERYRFKSSRLFSRFASRYRIPFEWFGGRKLYRTADLEAMRTPGQPLRRRMERAS